jgi:hypothetical protein
VIVFKDEELKLNARRAALKDYGFVCVCERCQEDERRRAKAKGKKPKK